MTTPVQVVYFDKGSEVRATEPGALAPGAVWLSEPHAPTVPPKRRGRPRKTAATTTTVAKPEPVVDARSRAKALEACRRYLNLYPRGGHLARWFREGQQDLRAAELQARARGDFRTSDLAEALLALGKARAEVRAALALPADIGRVKPEGET